jgi:hypothetical protein
MWCGATFDVTEYVELESKPPTKAPAADIATASTRPETSGVLVRRVGTTVPQTTIRQKKRPSTEHNIARPQTATTALIHVKLGMFSNKSGCMSACVRFTFGSKLSILSQAV